MVKNPREIFSGLSLLDNGAIARPEAAAIFPEDFCFDFSVVCSYSYSSKEKTGTAGAICKLCMANPLDVRNCLAEIRLWKKCLDGKQ